MKNHSIGTHLIHVDTTNFSVHGKYKNDAPDGTDSIRITFGHAKDGRTDLKRFVLGLVTNQFGLPLFTEAFSGNESDKKSIIKMIQKTQQAISIDDKSYWIADSALYTEDNIKLLGTEMRWITRAPATLDEIKRLLEAELNFTPGTDSRYAFYVTGLNYGGIPQRAVVVWSEEKQKRDEQTFDKKIQKEMTQAEKDLKKLMSRKFACIPDAKNEAKIWASVHPHHLIRNLNVLPVAEKVEKRRGRPKKDEPITISFKIEAQIDLNENALNDERKKLGRFVPNLPDQLGA